MLQSPLIQAFQRQADWCCGPSPFTARLLERSAAWLAQDAVAHAALAAAAADPVAGATALRWAGALHHLALRGLAPWADLWPPQQADAGDAELDAAIRAAWQTQRAAISLALASPPQTNEVQRSAALLPGLLHVAAATGLPLRLCEIGASAGLNLWPERHRYDYGSWLWGDSHAALALRCEWRGPVPSWAAGRLDVSARFACDQQPIDLTLRGEALRLAGFIWPDQTERLARLRAAQRAVTPWLAAEAVQVQALPAAAFVAAQLQAPHTGVATVLMHSVVWQYLGAAEQAAIDATVLAAAARATRSAPLAWLRLEPPAADIGVELRCRLWPGGSDQLLATVHPHGAWVAGCAA